MRRELVPVLAAALTLGATSAAAQTWVTTTHDYLTDQVREVVQSRDGRFLAVGNTGRALALLKRNSDGSLLWQRLYMGFPTGEGGNDLVELPDGRIAVAAEIFVDEHGNDDMGLVIFSPDGRTVLLQRAFGGGEGDDHPMDLLPTRDGGFLLVGDTLSWGRPGRAMLAIKLDAALDVQWGNAFDVAGDGALHAAVELEGGGYLAAGSGGAVLRLAADGALVWARQYGLAEIRQLAPMGGGRVAMVGWRTDGDADVAELLVVDAAGEVLWRTSYGQAGVTFRFFALTALPDGGFLAGGEVNGPGFTDLDGWLARLDATGAIVWQRHLDDGGGEVHAVSPTDGGGFVVGGHRNSFPEMMITRLDAAGQAAGCTGAATSAVAMPRTAAWSPLSLTVVPPAGLATFDVAKEVQEAPSPRDELVCRAGPTHRPSEVSPPAASGAPLAFESAQVLVWEPPEPSASTAFDLHRGDLAGLRAGTPPDCLATGLTASTFTDAQQPAPGAGFAYLVRGRSAAGVGTLGHASSGIERAAGAACH